MKKVGYSLILMIIFLAACGGGETAVSEPAAPVDVAVEEPTVEPPAATIPEPFPNRPPNRRSRVWIFLSYRPPCRVLSMNGSTRMRSQEPSS